VEVASDGAAVTAWDPKVGATSIQHNLELLRRGTDGDLGEVLSVQEVADGDGMAVLLALVGGLLEHLVGVALGTHTHVLLAKGVHVVADVGVLLLMG
jgi:hypothetical protein